MVGGQISTAAATVVTFSPFFYPLQYQERAFPEFIPRQILLQAMVGRQISTPAARVVTLSPSISFYPLQY